MGWSDDFSLVRATRERRVEDFAVEVLSRRSTNIRNRGKKLRELDARARHKLRGQEAAVRVRVFCKLVPDGEGPETEESLSLWLNGVAGLPWRSERCFCKSVIVFIDC
jgi:hypothetical protein